MPMTPAAKAGRSGRCWKPGSPVPRPCCTTRTTASTICSTAAITGSSKAASRSSSAGFRARTPAVYHNDHSRPETPRIRSLREELGRVVRGRAANPRWIDGVMRHGYKGAAEIAATVDYLFAFAATARAVDDAHFEALYDAYLVDDRVRGFIADNNPAALADTSRRFLEAIDRGLWRPRRNSAREELMRWSGDETRPAAIPHMSPVIPGRGRKPASPEPHQDSGVGGL